MTPAFSRFAAEVRTENAFDVLVAAQRMKAAGKDVVELEIGDSPFPTPPHAAAAGIAAIRQGHCRYGPSAGLSEFRTAAAEYVNEHYGLAVAAENVVAGPGGKTFQTLFCEAFLNPGDAALVFSPHFPTYGPNIARRGARMVLAPLLESRDFRPDVDDVRRFLDDDPSPRAIFLNSPHNPTGGVATQDDLRELADAVRGRDVAVLSDEPYDQMVWRGRHHTLLAEPDMLDHCVAAYTFSKSFSMSGWRLGFSVSSPRIAERLATLTNTMLSCVPPFTQQAGIAALRQDRTVRDERMAAFRRKVELLAAGLDQIDGVRCPMPAGTFYVFSNVAAVCNRLGITSQGLAMYLLEAADERFGVACLGGECFGAAGRGFLRFSCAEADERIAQAVEFLPRAFDRADRVQAFLAARAEFRLTAAYCGP
ncbi:MAG: aminotransferase class I/II-fold pyridoxal phosphate-dependent enzyme [Pirellulales bacterium]